MSPMLADLIQRRREELGHDGRPLPYEVIADRTGLPLSTVHALATSTEGVRRLDAKTLERLHALADALDLPPEQVERAVLQQLGARTIERHLTDDEELLLSTYRKLDDDEVAQLESIMRFLRSQRPTA